MDGRHIRVRSQHASLNFLLQSAGAIISKRAWVIFHSLALHLDYRQLGVIHDESVRVDEKADGLEEYDPSEF